VRRSVKAEVSSSTSVTSDPNRWAAAFSVIQASSNADGTYLSARRPISGDTVTCSSDADNTILSKRLPIDGDSLGSSSVSGRIVINQVEIYDLLVSGSCDLYGFLDRIRGLLTDNISGSASVYGSVLPDIGLTDGSSFGITEIESSLSPYYQSTVPFYRISVLPTAHLSASQRSNPRSRHTMRFGLNRQANPELKGALPLTPLI